LGLSTSKDIDMEFEGIDAVSILEFQGVAILHGRACKE
jgi:hypothetical protein